MSNQAREFQSSSSMTIGSSRAKLIEAIGQAREITFIRAGGNLGDELIYAGTRQLLAHLSYSEQRIEAMKGVTGETALISGSGGWCASYHRMPEYLKQIEAHFDRVIILPSSFDASLKSVREALGQSKALVFAREPDSYHQIRDLCNADLAHDCAFYFNFQPYRRNGRGVLVAYRTDRESTLKSQPPNNNDISLTCESLDEWLWTIARNELIRTDRAHVTIAAALLGKRVEYWASNYHKVPAIVEFSLRDFPVHRTQPDFNNSVGETANQSALPKPRSRRNSARAAWEEGYEWADQVHQFTDELLSIVPSGKKCILVNEDQFTCEKLKRIHVIPFVEEKGHYSGPPSDDDAGIRELERLRAQGASFIAFAWPAFWWLEHYSRFHQHLRSRFSCVCENGNLIAFALDHKR